MSEVEAEVTRVTLITPIILVHIVTRIIRLGQVVAIGEKAKKEAINRKIRK